MSHRILSSRNSNNHAKLIEGRRHFLSEAFHAFHQPLTALHCGLELSLLKNRTEEEYRHRIAEALEHAGAVLQLNKALRELAEAMDPGENFGRTELHTVLTQLADELSLVASVAQVAMEFKCPEGLFVSADAGKFSRHLGALADIVIADLQPGSTFVFNIRRDEGHVVVDVAGKGVHRETAKEASNPKLDAIRIDAAYSYVWTIGGDLKSTRSGFSVVLPALE